MRLPTAIERMQAASFVSREIRRAGHGLPAVADHRHRRAPGGNGRPLYRSGARARCLRRVFRPARRRRARWGRRPISASSALPSICSPAPSGLSSARLVIALMLERHSTHARGAMRLLDDASAAIQYNRDLLQSAIDNVDQGIAVFDRDMTLICWNSQFAGLPVAQQRDDARRHAHGRDRPGLPRPHRQRPGTAVVDRLRKDARPMSLFRERMTDTGQGAARSGQARCRMAAWSSPSSTSPKACVAADALQRANESLERRVVERTAELTRLNKALAVAKAEADAANTSKTQFIAAASHDILQPLNAARLFTSSLVERTRRTEEWRPGPQCRFLARGGGGNSVRAARYFAPRCRRHEAGYGALPHRRDAAGPGARVYAGRRARRISTSRSMPCGLTVETDRKLLRRVLQNFVSNAIKYTRQGEVLMGCRRRGSKLRIEVHDTGPGIPPDKRDVIFQEFQRLHGDDERRDWGSGCRSSSASPACWTPRSRFARRPSSGSCFAIDVPVAAVGLPRLPAARPQPLRTPGLPNAVTVLVIDNETADPRRHGNPAHRLGLHRSPGAQPGRGGRGPARRRRQDRHDPRRLSSGTTRMGSRSSVPCASGPASHIPAVLITADRSPAVADSAVAHDMHILRKPVKPAALRAAMSHVAVRTEAAE